MRFLIGLALIPVLLWLFVVVAIPSEVVRYRLTLMAEVSGQPVAGSGVIEVKQEDTTRVFGSMGGVGHEVHGEAVTLDLGTRGMLFALLQGNRVGLSEGDGFPGHVLLQVFGNRPTPRSSVLETMRTLKKERPRAVLPRQYYPMLVRFRDINDPTSVEQVDPSDLARYFGPGVGPLNAVIEVTNAAVTTGIERRLDWLGDVRKRGGALDGSRSSFSNELKNRLGALSFQRQ
jgi:hypothetical protein